MVIAENPEYQLTVEGGKLVLRGVGPKAQQLPKHHVFKVWQNGKVSEFNTAPEPGKYFMFECTKPKACDVLIADGLAHVVKKLDKYATEQKAVGLYQHKDFVAGKIPANLLLKKLSGFDSNDPASWNKVLRAVGAHKAFTLMWCVGANNHKKIIPSGVGLVLTQVVNIPANNKAADI